MKVLNFVLFLFASSATARVGIAPLFFKAENGRGIPNEYVVLLDDNAEPRGILQGVIDAIQATETETLRLFGNGTIPAILTLQVFENVVKGFTLKTNRFNALLNALDNLDNVTVTENQVIEISSVQTPVDSWGLDRVDQNTGFDDRYSYVRDGSNVDVYIVDTGIDTRHEDFGGRAKFGVDVTGSGEGDNDLDGHGTHVAGKFYQLLFLFIIHCTMISYLPLPFQELLEGLSTG
jgi:subtilisin family serine protease